LLRYRTGDWAVLQRAPDGRRELHSLCPAEEIRETLQAVFGAAINVQIHELDPSEAGEKWGPYISDCHPLLPYSGSWTT
jgi:hypothetical protein